MSKDKGFDREKQDRDDVAFLMMRPEFRRFMWRVIQSARIFQGATDGSISRDLNEGRRDLGLEILAMVEDGQPIAQPHPGGPILTISMCLNEEIQQPKGRLNDDTRFDRNAELDDGDDDPPSD